MQNGELSFTELIFNASLLVQVVMLILVSMSVISWTIIIQKTSVFKRGRTRADDFEDRFWSGIDLNNLYQDCMKHQAELQGLEVIYASGFKEFVRLVNSGPADQDVVMDGTYRQMKVAQSREVETLESHLASLATIGSISPYIGLFGTVWGIMHAFVALAAVKNATLSMVAPPIAEALIATAMGLFAAIPAVMFYNHFASKVEALENRYDNFMDEFATILNRRLVTVKSQMMRNEEKQEESAQQGSNEMRNVNHPQSLRQSYRNEEQYHQQMPPMRTVPPRYNDNNQMHQQYQAQHQYQRNVAAQGYDPRTVKREAPRYITPGVAGEQERMNVQKQMNTQSQNVQQVNAQMANQMSNQMQNQMGGYVNAQMQSPRRTVEPSSSNHPYNEGQH